MYWYFIGTSVDTEGVILSKWAPWSLDYTNDQVDGPYGQGKYVSSWSLYWYYPDDPRLEPGHEINNGPRVSGWDLPLVVTKNLDIFSNNWVLNIRYWEGFNLYVDLFTDVQGDPFLTPQYDHVPTVPQLPGRRVSVSVELSVT